ncbi:MAG: Outer membrane porin F [Owenweeksia sp. TMED14]|nr:MAG: Outer membrane porin F [Owenweeksia sp. TMED14]
MKFSYYAILIILLIQTSSLFGQIEVGDCHGYSNFSKQAILAHKAIESKDLIMAKVYLSAVNRKSDGQELNSLFLRSELAALELRFKEASSGYAEIYSRCPDYSENILFKWGLVLSKLGMIEESKKKFKDYLNQNRKELLNEYDVREILSLWEFRDSLRNNPVSYSPERVPELSTSADEFLGILSPDESSWYYTRRDDYIDFKLGPAPIRRLREEFCQLSATKDAKFSALRYPFNQGFNEGGPSVTADNRNMAITSCKRLKTGYRNCDIFLLGKHDDEWSDFEPITSINQDHTWEAQPAFSANGDRIIFASDRVGGYGGIDLYSVELDSMGSWGNLKNLGGRINTSGDEKSPFLHADDKHLFFSSTGHPGLGDYDVFVVSLFNNKKPSNLGFPINTSKNEVGFAVSSRTPVAYFSSNEKITGLKGASSYDFYRFSLPANAFPDEVSFIRGEINGAHDFSEGLQMRIENLSTKKVSRVRVDEITGEYTAVLNSSKSQDFLFSIESPNAGYTSTRLHISKGYKNYNTATLKAKKLKIGEFFDLHSVLFKSNSYNLSTSDKQALKSFARYFSDHRSLVVELQGHTDDLGYSNDNLILSKNRSRAVYDFLISSGVDPKQVSYKGYGDKSPIASNNKEQGRALNRRTVFLVLDL